MNEPEKSKEAARAVSRGGPLLAVIFDLDGILVYSIPVHCEAYRRTFAAEGVEFTFEDYQRWGSGTARDVLIRRVMGDLPDDKLQKLMDAKVRHVQDCIRENGLDPIPGAAKFVREVRRRGLKTAVATASRTPKLLLQGAGLGDLFDVILDRNQVERPKPHPEIYLVTARILGVEPRRCLVLEDSPVGVDAGLEAGMRVIALTTTEPPEKLSRAHGVYDSFEDIDLEAWIDGDPPCGTSPPSL